jgi:hypothetical protein
MEENMNDTKILARAVKEIIDLFGLKRIPFGLYEAAELSEIEEGMSDNEVRVFTTSYDSYNFDAAFLIRVGDNFIKCGLDSQVINLHLNGETILYSESLDIDLPRLNFSDNPQLFLISLLMYYMGAPVVDYRPMGIGMFGENFGLLNQCLEFNYERFSKFVDLIPNMSGDLRDRLKDSTKEALAKGVKENRKNYALTGIIP